jgi:NADH:ubiquinone oxidoreductase subunit F (NADH-binding)
MTQRLLPPAPITSVSDYIAVGGGAGIGAARDVGPTAAIETVRSAGLRGRGGAGFPTGIKWEGLAGADSALKYVVCNAAEGEPGTFKDRWLLRTNPYQVLEGLAIAGFVTGAQQCFLGIKAKFEWEISRLEQAAAELTAAGLIGDIPISIVEGPDDYLFGEEKALLEVVEGHDPLPRLHPPYVQGLFESTGGPAQPAVVNNVETLANVPWLLAHGAAWFRSVGTDQSPGTMVFTIGGDTVRHVVVEATLGTPLFELVEEHAGGVAAGRGVAIVTNGVSNRPLRPDQLEVPLAYEAMRAVGSGLGSGGFTVYDETTCVVQVAVAHSGFSARGSCGQCPPCKLGTEAITDRLRSLAPGTGAVRNLEEIAAWTTQVTDANRCGLGAGEQAFVRGILDEFAPAVADHIGGHRCRRVRPVPVIEDWDDVNRRFFYAADPSLALDRQEKLQGDRRTQT